MQFELNGTATDVPDEAMAPDMPLLWVLRDVLNLTGTKFGCGIGACGACTVTVDGRAARACVTPMAEVAGKQVRTIEGLGATEHRVLQQAWLHVQAPQCGYCQSGMLMAASALLAQQRRPARADIEREITNLCRCGTYQRVVQAVELAAQQLPAPARAPAPRRRGAAPEAPSARLA